MAIELQDNFTIEANKPIDGRYGPYSSLLEANTAIPISYRYLGLTVLINSVEYWYALGVSDLDLTPKFIDFTSDIANLNSTVNTLQTTVNGLSSTVNILQLTKLEATDIIPLNNQVNYLSSLILTKQDSITLTTTGTAGPATLVGNTLNIPGYTIDGLGGVSLNRELTINGVTQNLSANRTWTIDVGVTSFNTRSGAISLTQTDVLNALGNTPIYIGSSTGGDLLGTYPFPTVNWSNGNSTYDSRYVRLSVSYDNPSWLNSLAYSKLTGAPTNLSSFTNDVGFITSSTAASTYFPLLGGSLTGSGGNGFIGFPIQSSAPSTPSTGFRLYADSSNRFSWKGTNGYVRTLDGTSNTADRIYTLPNNSGTLALTSTSFQQSGNAFGATATLGTTDTHDLNIITNNSTRLTIASTGNLAIGGSVISTRRLSIYGADSTSSNFTLSLYNSGSSLLFSFRNDGQFRFGSTSFGPSISLVNTANTISSSGLALQFRYNNAEISSIGHIYDSVTTNLLDANTSFVSIQPTITNTNNFNRTISLLQLAGTITHSGTNILNGLAISPTVTNGDFVAINTSSGRHIFGGAIDNALRLITGAVTLNSTDYFVQINASTNFIITLPTITNASNTRARVLILKRIDTNAGNTVTLTPASGSIEVGTISSSSTIRLYWDNTNTIWRTF